VGGIFFDGQQNFGIALPSLCLTAWNAFSGFFLGREWIWRPSRFEDCAALLQNRFKAWSVFFLDYLCA
jgi:hypothetical protein